ncbi:MAG: tyrosine--tRNA ligase [Rickettsiales bacterium]|jgi:tyrosyl-tRNA synthetase|nr:tyrosine--tRNA ligase [Rickettsiales bacterium]
MSKYKSKFLQESEKRGFLNQYTNIEILDEKLCSGVPVVAYWGTDPTSDSLHVGHLFSLMTVRLFQKCGNKPIMLVGGSTGLIGDPSGRDTSRPMITKEKIESNKDGIKKSLSKFLTFGDGPTDAIMVDNYDWCGKLNWVDFLRDIGPHISINKMLTMDSVKTRLSKEEHMSFLEFNYMVMQAYDFYHLNRTYNCTLQFCGADQWGNAVAGIDLIRRMQFVNDLSQQDVHVMTSPLLSDKSGRKVGKTAGNAIWINEDKLSDYDYYQYFRNIDDDDIEKFLKIYTDFELDEILKIIELKEPNEAKKILAFETTKLCRGENVAKSISEQAKAIFEDNSLDALPVLDYDLNLGETVAKMLFNLKLSDSIGDAKREIQGGSVKINDVKVVDISQAIGEDEFKLTVGKKKRYLIKIKK